MTKIPNHVTFAELTSVYYKAKVAATILQSVADIKPATDMINFFVRKDELVESPVFAELVFLLEIAKRVSADAKEEMHRRRCTDCPQFIDGKCVRGETPDRCC